MLRLYAQPTYHLAAVHAIYASNGHDRDEEHYQEDNAEGLGDPVIEGEIAGIGSHGLFPFCLDNHHHSCCQTLIILLGEAYKVDAHRHALLYLHEVAGGVVGRNE